MKQGRSHRLRMACGVVSLAGMTTSTAVGQTNPTGTGVQTASTSDGAPAKAAAPASHGDTVWTARSEFSAYSDNDAVSVFTPEVEAAATNPVAGWSASGSYLVDVVSAASVDIVSTASEHWVETRHAATIGGGYKPGTVGANLSGAVSREPDYLSLSGGGALVFELADKTVNPTVGYSYTHDTAGRKDTPFSVLSHELVRHSAFAGIELILDPSTLISLRAEGMFEAGDQTKPYRMLPLFAPDVIESIPRGAPVQYVNERRLPGRIAEMLPDTRNRLALSGRIAQRLSGSTLILSERLYADDWGLKASTTDLRFVFDLNRRVLFWTHLRGHIQSGVSFWHRAYSGVFAAGQPLIVPKYRSGDREMSSLAGGTFGSGLRWDLGADPRPRAWSFVLQADLFTTVFNDALFIQNRTGYLGVMQIEAEF